MEDRGPKVSRAQERVRTIDKKRLNYERNSARHSCQGRRPLALSVRSSPRAHRCARAATRTCLAKGLVKTSADMPAVNNRWAKMLNFNLSDLDCGYDGWMADSLATDFDFPEQLFALEDHEVLAGYQTPCPSVAVFLHEAPRSPRRKKAKTQMRRAGSHQLEVVKDEQQLDNDAVPAHIEMSLGCKVAEGSEGKQLPQAPSTIDWESRVKAADLAPDQVPSIVQAILQAMRADVEDAALQTAATQALSQLASSGSHNASAVAAGGGLQALVSAAEAHKSSVALQEMFCSALRAITICGPEYRTAVTSGGGVRLVLSSMTEHPKSVPVQLAGCRALKELAAHNRAIQDEIFTLSGIEMVLGAMEANPSVASMQEAGCGVLRNMTVGNAESQNKIVALGGARLVLAAMSLHGQEAPVQWAACWALFCLTVQNNEVRGKMVACGALLHVLQAMERHRAAPRVQEAGCWAIKVLTTADEQNLGLCSRVVAGQAMKDHPFDELVQKAGRVALQSASMRPPTSRASERGCMPESGRLAAPTSKKRKCSLICSLPTILE